VFNSNADPLEQGRTYSKFAAYTHLNHGGDYRAAAVALREQGYGAGPTLRGTGRLRPRP
jgi:hypothetical protein